MYVRPTVRGLALTWPVKCLSADGWLGVLLARVTVMFRCGGGRYRNAKLVFFRLSEREGERVSLDLEMPGIAVDRQEMETISLATQTQYILPR